MSLLDLFKKKYNLKYTISFDQEIPKASDEEDGGIKYLDYVNAKDISNDIKVKGTKYYMAHSIISNNTSDFIKFTIYFRCRYDKKGKDYIREDLKILVQKAFGIYNYNTKTINYATNCDIDLENLLKDHVDFIFEDLDYLGDEYRILFSFKGYKDRDNKDIEGYVSFSSFDNPNLDTKFLDYLKKVVINKTVK